MGLRGSPARVLCDHGEFDAILGRTFFFLFFWLFLFGFGRRFPGCNLVSSKWSEISLGGLNKCHGATLIRGTQGSRIGPTNKLIIPVTRRPNDSCLATLLCLSDPSQDPPWLLGPGFNRIR